MYPSLVLSFDDMMNRCLCALNALKCALRRTGRKPKAENRECAPTFVRTPLVGLLRRVFAVLSFCVPFSASFSVGVDIGASLVNILCIFMCMFCGFLHEY